MTDPAAYPHAVGSRVKLGGRVMTVTAHRGPYSVVLDGRVVVSTSSGRVVGFEYDEQSCPGHTASDGNVKICRHCGTHVDELRPDDGPF